METEFWDWRLDSVGLDSEVARSIGDGIEAITNATAYIQRRPGNLLLPMYREWQ